MKELDNFYDQKETPIKECLLALRNIILTQDENVKEFWKYKLPVFCYKGKMFCYLWIHKKQNKPYLGIVEGKYFDHPELIQEKRSRMKIMLFEPEKNIPLQRVNAILQHAISLYITKKNSHKEMKLSFNNKR